MFINSLQACRLLRHQSSLGAQVSALVSTLMDSASRSNGGHGPLASQGLDGNATLQYPNPVKHQFRRFSSCTSSLSSVGVPSITSVKEVKCSSTPLRALSSQAEASATAAQEACAPHHGHLHAFVEPLLDGYEGVSVLTLNRPLARNAIGKQMLQEIRECINNLRQEPSTRCVLVRSLNQGVFCAGADLKERRTMTIMETSEFVRCLRNTFTALRELPMPTVAVLEGLALGGGAELALACDLRVGGRDAVLGFPETLLGIIPGAGGTQSLPRLIGLSRAKELIFTGRRVHAEEALSLGLLDFVVDSGKAYPRALQLTGEMCKAGPLALQAAKTAMNGSLDVDLHTGLQLEGSCYTQLLHSKDRAEGLAAFEAKRPPRFTGN